MIIYYSYFQNSSKINPKHNVAIVITDPMTAVYEVLHS